MRNILIFFFLILSIFISASEPFDLNVEYMNMIRYPIGIERYKFFDNNKYELMQRGGDYMLTKGKYNTGKDDFGSYIELIAYFFNYGSDEDNKYEPPQKIKYYISNNSDIFILFQTGKENHENSFQAYSTDVIYFLEGRYSASTTLIENKNNPDLYNPDKMSSKYYLNEFWSEGKKGYGINEKINIEFIPFEFEEYGPDVKAVPVKLSGVVIFNGVLKSTDLYYKNSRVKELTIKYSNGNIEQIKLKDAYIPQIINLNETANNITDVELIINDVYKGSKWDDTCITKILFYGIYN